MRGTRQEGTQPQSQLTLPRAKVSQTRELKAFPRPSRGFVTRRVSDTASHALKQRISAAKRTGDQPIKSLNFLTHQEIFNQTVDHLFGQKRAALLPRGGGAYRGYCGGCPVGNFIKPRDYMTAMEGVPVRYIGKTSIEVPSLYGRRRIRA
jgi:hypothetical protein